MKRLLFVAVAVVILAAALIPAASAQSPGEWRVDFYPNLNWAGAPVLTQIVPGLSVDWGTGSPGPNMPPDNWTMRAVSTQYFYSGVYRFTVVADDEFLLMIDSTVIMDTRGRGQSGKTLVMDIPVNQGNRTLRVDFREFTGAAYIRTSWAFLKPSGGGGQPPQTLPPPPPASSPSVQTKYGDYTPCIQSNAHQANCFVSDGAWDSPNRGSIELEPQIRIWGNCQPADSDVTWTMDPRANPPLIQSFRCSKTLAGWFQK